jgi:hypothetical protein
MSSTPGLNLGPRGWTLAIGDKLWLARVNFDSLSSWNWTLVPGTELWFLELNFGSWNWVPGTELGRGGDLFAQGTYIHSTYNDIALIVVQYNKWLHM